MSEDAPQLPAEELGSTAVNEATKVLVTEGNDSPYPDRVEDVEKAHVMALAGDEKRTEAAKWHGEAKEAEDDFYNGPAIVRDSEGKKHDITESKYRRMEEANERAGYSEQQAKRLEEEAGRYYENPAEAKQRASDIRAELAKVRGREKTLTDELQRIDELNPHLTKDVELPDGTRIVREASGHEWVAYSPTSGLTYSGPDDYVGQYA